MSRNDLLGEIASDAALERTDFLATATAQLRGFLEANEERLRQLGGLVLIDEDPDYLSVAPDGTFRSRTRYQDEQGAWHSETEVIESAADLVELYNPADVYAAFVEAAKEAAGFEPEPTGAEDLPATAGIAAADTVALEEEGRAYAEAADRWAESRGEEPADANDAARRLYDLALEFQDESQGTEANLLSRFEGAAAQLTGLLGDMIITDDEDERLTLLSTGELVAEVLPEGAETWERLTAPDQLVEYYDPTDIFSDLADAIAEAFPSVAPPPMDGAPEAEVGEGEEASPDDDEDGR